MAAMVAPHIDSVQTHSLARRARPLKRAVSAKSGLGLKYALTARAGAPRGRAAQPRWRRRPPTHSQPRGPRKTARTQSARAGARRRDSESLAARRHAKAKARPRGYAITVPRAARPQAHSKKDRTHTPNTRPRLRIPTNPPTAGPHRSNGTSPASPRTTTTST